MAGQVEYMPEWTELKRLDNSTEKYQKELVRTLGEMYWKGVEREVAAVIMAMADISEIHPNYLPEEEKVDSDLQSDRLAELLDLWGQ